MTTNNRAEDGTPLCPYWHEVSADFISMYPAAGYCIAGCQGRVKVMAQQTLEQVCAMNFAECEGYQRVLAEEEANAAARPETLRR